MRTIISQLFAVSNFSEEELSTDATFYAPITDTEIEYYLVYYIAKDSLGNYTARHNYVSALASLKEKNATLGNIDKNTSLILCVQMEDLRADCTSFKHDLLRIEEEAFQFKHYVLPYVPTALATLSTSSTILADLNTLVNDERRFRAYFSDSYADSDYFLAIQLFLKLPFLGPFPPQTAAFQSIDQIVDQYIDLNHVRQYYAMAISDDAQKINLEQLEQQALNVTTDDFEATMIILRLNAN
jgi:hypothetical protein